MKITLSLSEYSRMKNILSQKIKSKPNTSCIDKAQLKKMGINTSIGLGSVTLSMDESLAVTVLEMLSDKTLSELKDMASNAIDNHSVLDTVASILVKARLRVLKKSGIIKG